MKLEHTLLPISIRLLIFQLIFSGKPVSAVIDELDDEQCILLQQFVWDKAIEFGIKSKGKNFSRKDITSRMLASSAYQQQQKCTEPLYTCKASYCIQSHPECARLKIKGQVDVMGEVIREFVQTSEQKKKASIN